MLSAEKPLAKAPFRRHAYICQRDSYLAESRTELFLHFNLPRRSRALPSVVYADGYQAFPARKFGLGARGIRRMVVVSTPVLNPLNF
jgi:hypothetical protein